MLLLPHQQASIVHITKLIFSRCIILQVTLSRPHLLIFDEPTNHLDIESVDALCDAIKAFNGGLVMVTHNVQLIKAAECQLWVCRNSKKTGSSFTTLPSINDYKKEVMRDVERRVERAAARARERTAQRAAARKQLLG